MAGTTVHTLENQQLLEQVERESAAAARQLAETAHLRKGQLVVIGCSTSEVVGHQAGSWSTPEVADAIFRGLDSVFGPMGVYMAAQCCEHLNRALIVEYEVVPGEEIRADAGLDIGGTLIGMHLKKVAVPVRLEQDHIGQAIVLAARVRPKFIGGDRAVYDETLKEGYPDLTD
mgnify:CR=1 FL=1